MDIQLRDQHTPEPGVEGLKLSKNTHEALQTLPADLLQIMARMMGKPSTRTQTVLCDVTCGFPPEDMAERTPTLPQDTLRIAPPLGNLIEIPAALNVLKITLERITIDALKVELQQRCIKRQLVGRRNSSRAS